jgi:hypothetical protein
MSAQSLAALLASQPCTLPVGVLQGSALDQVPAELPVVLPLYEGHLAGGRTWFNNNVKRTLCRTWFHANIRVNVVLKKTCTSFDSQCVIYASPDRLPDSTDPLDQNLAEYYIWGVGCMDLEFQP